MKGISLIINLAILSLTIIFTIACDSSNEPKSNNGTVWEQDLDYIAKELPARHFNLFTIISSEKFNSDISSLKEKVNTIDDVEVFLSLSKIIASIGDAHTSIKSNDYSDLHFFPFSCYYFSDGLYIISASENNENIIGRRIIGIGEYSIEQVFDLLKPFISHENDSQLLNAAPNYLIFAELLKYVGVIDDIDNAIVKFDGIDEISIESEIFATFSQLKNIHIISPESESYPLYLKNTDNYWYEYLPESELLYFQYNLCSEEPNKPFEEYSSQLFSYISNIAVKKVVLDLRKNPGGNSSILKPFVDQISTIDSLNKLGSLFVIVGRETFSSAILNTLEMQNRTNSIFYGEPTGGKPNHFGEVRSFDLPNHNYSIRYSTKYFTHNNEDTPSFNPENIIAITFDDYKNGNDPILEAIIKR